MFLMWMGAVQGTQQGFPKGKKLEQALGSSIRVCLMGRVQGTWRRGQVLKAAQLYKGLVGLVISFRFSVASALGDEAADIG